MWGLYYASLCDYPYDEHINERQMNIRHNLKLIKESGLLSNGKLLAAYVLAYCYCLGKIFKFLYLYETHHIYLSLKSYIVCRNE